MITNFVTFFLNDFVLIMNIHLAPLKGSILDDGGLYLLSIIIISFLFFSLSLSLSLLTVSLSESFFIIIII